MMHKIRKLALAMVCSIGIFAVTDAAYAYRVVYVGSGWAPVCSSCYVPKPCKPCCHRTCYRGCDKFAWFGYYDGCYKRCPSMCN